MALLVAGCATVPRPVPEGGQPVASAQVGGVILTVPRLDYGAYPDDILEISAAVFVAVENRSSSEISIALEDFVLGPPGGMGYSPVPPQQLVLTPSAQRRGQGLALLSEGSPALAGPVVGRGVAAPAPAFRGGGGISVPAPAFRGGGPVYRGGSVYRGGPGYRGLSYRGGWGGPGWYGPGWYGAGWYGYGPWWGLGFYGPGLYGARTYADSREDATRLALPAGRLPPGGRTAGFLYFPRNATPEDGVLTLRWQVHAEPGRQSLGEATVNLEVSDE